MGFHGLTRTEVAVAPLCVNAVVLLWPACSHKAAVMHPPQHPPTHPCTPLCFTPAMSCLQDRDPSPVWMETLTFEDVTPR